VDARLLEILVCPLCKGPLKYDRNAQELICATDKLAFPIQDGIPVMLADEARTTVEGRRVDPDGPATTGASAVPAASNASASNERSPRDDQPSPDSL